MKKEKVFAEIKRRLDKRNRNYLTEEAAWKYQKLCDAVSDSDVSDVGIRRVIRCALMEEHGLLEIEAINILNGYHVRDYVDKYQKQKWVDEMRDLMFLELQEMECPEELYRDQIEALLELFAENWFSSRMKELRKSEDKRECIHRWLEKIL